jgi:hypothetical protein
MEEHPNVAATRAAIEAFMKGDAETMMGAIADDAVWHVPGNNHLAGEFEGVPAIAKRFELMANEGIAIRPEEIHDIVGGEDHVVALVQVTGSKGANSFTGRSVWVFHVRDGKATEFWGYNEDQAAVDALIDA